MSWGNKRFIFKYEHLLLTDFKWSPSLTTFHTPYSLRLRKSRKVREDRDETRTTVKRGGQRMSVHPYEGLIPLKDVEDVVLETTLHLPLQTTLTGGRRIPRTPSTRRKIRGKPNVPSRLSRDWDRSRRVVYGIFRSIAGEGENLGSDKEQKLGSDLKCLRPLNGDRLGKLMCLLWES